MKILNNENGFVLVLSLMILVILMLIGIAATNTTIIELQIAGNDKVAKQTFYRADGGTQAAIELVEECIEEVGCVATDIGAVRINNLDFYLNDAIDWTNPDANLPNTSLPPARPRTELVFGGETKVAPGSAMQAGAGYEGKGKSLGSGGTYVQYDIGSLHLGQVNSETRIIVEWNHIM